MTLKLVEQLPPRPSVTYTLDGIRDFIITHPTIFHSLAMSRPLQRLHPASRIPVAAHNQHLLHLVSGSVTEEMIEYLTRYTMNTIQVVGEASESITQPAGLVTSPHTSTDSPDESTDIRSAQGYFSLHNFIGNLVRSSHLSVSTVLATTIYLDRLRAKLTPSAKGWFISFPPRIRTSSCPRNSLGVHQASRFLCCSHSRLQVPQRLFPAEYPLAEIHPSI